MATIKRIGGGVTDCGKKARIWVHLESRIKNIY
jgi:hypothetical protein